MICAIAATIGMEIIVRIKKIANKSHILSGSFVPRINPNTNPATVDLDFNRALYWVQVGALPTDTVRNILSREGVYLMKHLLGGVKKGAFDEATAQSKFEAWKSEKENKLQGITNADVAAKKAAHEARLKSEQSVKEAIAKKIAEKNAPVAEETPEEEAPAEEAQSAE